MEIALARYAFQALGTRCCLHVAGVGERRGEAFACAAADLLRAREARWSRFRPDSLISRINTAAGDGTWFELQAEDEALLEACASAWRASAGACDPTILPLSRLWLGESAPTPDELATTCALVGWPQVERRAGAVRLARHGMALDVGGIGKELLADTLLRLADDHAIDDILIDLGGDLVARGRPPGRRGWRIALADPADAARSWACVTMAGGAIATSGHGQRSVWRDGRRIAHLIDPRSGRPADTGVEQVTVLAADCVSAGRLASRACLESPAAAEALIAAAGVPGTIHAVDGRRLVGGVARLLEPASPV